MIVARIFDARSKLATARGLNPETAVSSLGRTLALGSVDENELYWAMDWLLARQKGIERRLAKRHLNDNTLMLYDLTTSWNQKCPGPYALEEGTRAEEFEPAGDEALPTGMEWHMVTEFSDPYFADQQPYDTLTLHEGE